MTPREWANGAGNRILEAFTSGEATKPVDIIEEVVRLAMADARRAALEQCLHIIDATNNPEKAIRALLDEAAQ